jgi:glycosyltransferase involved in cell wall biosynthesis
MKVAFLTHSYGDDHGVVGRHVHVLATEVARTGGTAEVLLHTTGHRRLPPAEPGITVRRFSSWIPGGKYASSHALWSYLRGHGGEYDLLHAHGEAMLPAVLLAQATPRHLIVTPHFYASSAAHLRRMAQGRGDHIADRQVLARAERVLCVSQSEGLLVGRYAPKASVYVIPNGSDAESIAEGPHSIDRHVILSVDRLTRWAGIQRVISALPTLPAFYHLVVVGRGRARSMLEAHADYLGVGDRVRFLGGVSDAVLHRWLSTASVVATLKEEDLWGGTLLTAASAGIPVVASDMPAHREAARMAGSEGIRFVSRRASPFAVADAVTGLAATGSRPFAALVPTWDDLAEETLSVYREVLDDAA